MKGKNTRRTAVSICTLMLSFRVLASDHDDQPINTASELSEWCKGESEATFIGRGLKPNDWTASYSDEGSLLVAKGEWHVDAATVSVVCRVARGAHAEFASMTISP